MKLSTKGRYAVTAMADIAQHANGQPLSLAEISGRQNISLAYLEQLFGKLRRAGLVDSMRGPGGGYTLARPADEIAVSQIMAAVEERLQATQCSGEVGNGCGTAGTRCLTHNLWERLSAHVHLFLQQTTLEDVIATEIAPCPAVPDFIGHVETSGDAIRD
jgi:Rrf2 family iron-sulfur cluster assembly transcriptional regulator